VSNDIDTIILREKMMSHTNDYLQRTLNILQQATILLTEDEQQRIEIATFGLPDYPASGLQLLTYVNSPRYCAKELVLFPGQTCPEHLHPPFAGTPGKQETFRCRWGEVWLFVDDNNLAQRDNNMACRVPEGSEAWYTCTGYVLLRPGE
jgi:D-lyxose ketol-isomerase